MTAWCQNCNGLLAAAEESKAAERHWRKLLLEERKARDVARAELAALQLAVATIASRQAIVNAITAKGDADDELTTAEFDLAMAIDEAAGLFSITPPPAQGEGEPGAKGGG
jgi:hypothetical protein